MQIDMEMKGCSLSCMLTVLCFMMGDCKRNCKAEPLALLSRTLCPHFTCIVLSQSFMVQGKS